MLSLSHLLLCCCAHRESLLFATMTVLDGVAAGGKEKLKACPQEKKNFHVLSLKVVFEMYVPLCTDSLLHSNKTN